VAILAGRNITRDEFTQLAEVKVVFFLEIFKRNEEFGFQFSLLNSFCGKAFISRSFTGRLGLC
jgi:hypothetical protein